MLKNTVNTIALSSLLFCYSLASPAGTPTLYMQSATLNGAADTVTLSRVPVADANGNITYKDIAMNFLVDSTGTVTLDNASVTIAPSAILNVGQFKPGTYHGQITNGDYVYIVGAPGVGVNGRISGSIGNTGNNNSSADFYANWTSGSINGHPYQALLNQAKITSTAYSWGVLGKPGASGWKAGNIIGVVQNGNQLSITNFGLGNIPLGVLSFNLCPTAAAC